MPRPKLPRNTQQARHWGQQVGRASFPRKRTPTGVQMDLSKTECFKLPAYCIRVPLNSKGFDPKNAYWDLSKGPLWWITNGPESHKQATFHLWIRASTRAEAQRAAEAQAPGLITWKRKANAKT